MSRPELPTLPDVSDGGTALRAAESAFDDVVEAARGGNADATVLLRQWRAFANNAILEADAVLHRRRLKL